MNDTFTKDECLQHLVKIYKSDVEPGWEQIKVRLTVMAKGGICLGFTAYVCYPGQAAITFVPPVKYDEDGDLVSVDEGDFFLALWEQNQQTEPWYAATLTIFPDGQYLFEPVPGPELTFDESQAFQDQLS